MKGEREKRGHLMSSNVWKKPQPEEQMLKTSRRGRGSERWKKKKRLNGTSTLQKVSWEEKTDPKETAERLMEKRKAWREEQVSKMLSYRCKISVDTEGWKSAVLTQCSK